MSNIIHKPNVIISCIDPSSSSNRDRVYVNGSAQIQTINPYGHLTLPIGIWKISISAKLIMSPVIEIEIKNANDEFEIKYVSRFLRTQIEVKKIQ